MQLLLVDWDFDILPVFRRQRTVWIEASRIRLWRTDEDANAVGYDRKKSSLSPIQIDSPY